MLLTVPTTLPPKWSPPPALACMTPLSVQHALAAHTAPTHGASFLSLDIYCHILKDAKYPFASQTMEPAGPIRVRALALMYWLQILAKLSLSISCSGDLIRCPQNSLGLLDHKQTPQGGIMSAMDAIPRPLTSHWTPCVHPCFPKGVGRGGLCVCVWYVCAAGICWQHSSVPGKGRCSSTCRFSVPFKSPWVRGGTPKERVPRPGLCRLLGWPPPVLV